MSEAGVLTCPSCGAAVAEGVRRCAHCGVPVATVRCAVCFQMSSAQALHCSGCGHELGLEPIPREPSLECPDCRVLMTVFDCGPGALHDCGRCGGQFVEHPALRDLLERHERDAPSAASARARAAGPADVRVRYVACPACRALMNRKNFGGDSGVIVDVCSKHGTWFDAGELPRVVAFAESGGLARARRRDREAREQLRHENAERRIAAVTVPGSAAPHDVHDSVLTDLLRELFTRD